ncbi:MAG: TonB-dependent receptor [Pseudomonadota bacterium]
MLKLIARQRRDAVAWQLILALAVFGAVPSAQAEDAEASIEEIVVTGSRLKRDSNLTGALPVQTVGERDIKLSGEFSITDVINDVPALLNSVSSEQSVDAAAVFSDGANVLNLRGLGVDRTLTLVDGRRHVGGVQGTSAVDVGSIPVKLIDRVEVLTGGASAVYGADAVTGVVNFILKDDFEGFEIDANYGISDEGDGQQLTLSGIWGTNFNDGRGNVTVAVDYRKDDGLQVSDRRDGALIGSARDWVNPDLRFQIGDIGDDTPNLAQFYNFANTGLTNYGLAIPGIDAFQSDYEAQFGVLPSLTTAEVQLLARAANAPQRAVLPGRTFPFTSGYGYIIPGNPFTFAGFDPETPIDLDGNGTPDCLDSFTGYNSVFGAASFGVVGGCWNVTEDGQYRPVQDGLVSGNFQGFGGDSFNTIQNRRGDVLLPDEKITVNLLGRYDLTETASVFGELKYVTAETDTDARPGSFWDLLFGAPDNPFLPDFIRPVADATGGVATTIDPLLFPNVRETERETYRAVLGIEGEFSNGWTYELSGNYGRYEESVTTTNSVIVDRFFAAIDATTDGSGNPACRVEVDPAAPALNTPFGIPAWDEGYFSFTPGAGQCVPLNIWAGQPGVTEAATNFVTTPTLTKLEIDQLVITGFVSGTSEGWFELPGGPVAFVFGGEYRDESSDASFDDFQRGIIPANAAFPAGTALNSVSGNESLLFQPSLSIINEKGDYDVTDLFVEVSLPLLADQPGVRELTVEGALRWADYSTIGSATTWKANLIYAPSDDLSVRGGFSRAVRAPNITELFGPQTGTTFRPADPCDVAQIAAIEADNPALAANFRNNCIADFQSIGIDPFDGAGNYAFADPLSAAFPGVQGGNPNLEEETADTYTIGLVLNPRFLPDFTLTVDYWDISIEDAIAAVTSQNIVDGCYRGANLNDAFCSLFTRNPDPTSLQAGGFNFLISTDINFAEIETSGMDFNARYGFDVAEGRISVSAQATWVDEINFFTNPSDLSDVDVELGEVNRPEWAGSLRAIYERDNFALAWNAQYLGEQLVSFVEIDTADTLYGPAVEMDDLWIHSISAEYMLQEGIQIYGGVRNLTNKKPFATDRAWPASPRGRFFFLGVTYSR